MRKLFVLRGFGSFLFFILFLFGFVKVNDYNQDNEEIKNHIKQARVVEEIPFSLIDSYVSNYEFYNYEVATKCYYLADVLNPSVFNKKLVALRLIEDVGCLDDIPFPVDDYLHCCFLEEVKYLNRELFVNYYLLDSDDANKIKNCSISNIEDFDTKNRLNTSFSFLRKNARENIVTLSLQDARSVKRIQSNINEPAVNEQAPLDYYLKTKNIDLMSDSVEYPDVPGSNLRHHYDDAITTLLPKSFFTTSGTKHNIGLEWGYYVRTGLSTDDTYVSEVLIYDVIQLRSSNANPDIVKVVVVNHNNYKCSIKEHCPVFEYGENNLCLGNPALESSIVYATTNDDLNSKIHPNPGDSNYNSATDLGFAFENCRFKHVGRGKNSDHQTSLAYSLLGRALSSTLSSVASALIGALPVSPELSVFGQFVVGNLIDDVVSDWVDSWQPEFYKVSKKTENDKFVYDYIMPQRSYDNFKTRAQHGDLIKHTYFRMPPYGNVSVENVNTQGDKRTKLSNANIPNNRQTPLLFKDSTDYIFFYHEIKSSELGDDYTALVNHVLKLDIFEDDSIFFWRWDPDYLVSETLSWAYTIAKDYQPKVKTISSNNPIYVSYGTLVDQELLFTPTTTSKYDIVLNNATPGTTIFIDGVSSNPTKFCKTFREDVTASGYTDYEFQNTYKTYVTLNAGTTYHIQIRRESNKYQYFGSGVFSIYEATPSIGVIQNYTLNESSSHKFTRTVNYHGMLQTKQLLSNQDTFVMISLQAPRFSSDDPYIMILDDFYRPVTFNDDGMGHSDASLMFRICANSPVYIVSRLYEDEDSTLEFEMNVYEGMLLQTLDNNKSDGVFECRLIFDFSENSNRTYYMISVERYCRLSLYSPGCPFILRDSYFDAMTEEETRDISINAQKDRIYILDICPNTHPLIGVSVTCEPW